MTFWRSNAPERLFRLFWCEVPFGPPVRALLASALMLGLCAGCTGRLQSPGGAPLRVGTSGDYAPFSTSSDPGWDGREWNGSGEIAATPPTGFDPAVAQAYAKDRGLVIEWVRFRWPDLLNDLAEDRFDLAMSGVTVRPDRSLAGRFSVPVCETGAVLLIDRQGRAFASIPLAAHDSLADLDRPTFRIAVNAGGHLERVTRRQFPHATVTAIPDNAAVLARVMDGKADAAVSDTQEAPGWSAKAPSLEIWGPFTRDRKAYLVRPELAELAFDLDDWLQAREADGRLAELRSAYLRGQQPALATGVPALVSGIAERLALMPMVAEAKRRSGQAIEVPLREERVIQAGIVKTREIALARGMTAPSPGAVREFYRGQIEAAKAIQRSVLAGPVTLTSPPDLTLELRPALIRIGDRLADLIVGLPMSARAAHTSGSQILAQTRAALAPLGLDDAHIDAIASAIESISSTRSAPGGADTP